MIIDVSVYAYEISVMFQGNTLGTFLIDRFSIKTENNTVYWEKETPNREWCEIVLRVFYKLPGGTEIMTIEIDNHSVEIRVTSDIDGEIGIVEVRKDGVIVNGQLIPWSV